MRCGFLTKTDEARNSGSFQKRETAFHRGLGFVRVDQVQIGQGRRIKDVGSHKEGRLVAHRALQRV